MLVLCEENSIAQMYLAEIRDKHVQKDRMRFRRNLERLGSILAYEISKSLSYNKVNVETPLGTKEHSKLNSSPILICVLRAGLPFYQGFLNIFDSSDSGFVGAYRSSEEKNEEIRIESHYFTKPNLDNKDVIIIDPMLATGKSFLTVLEQIRNNFVPRSVHVACLLASKDGIETIKNNSDCNLWAVDVDEDLNEYAYIVPGLGDAGDLSFGNKI